MITKADMEKVIGQVNSILADMHQRIEALENEVETLKAKPKGGRPRKVDTVKEGN